MGTAVTNSLLPFISFYFEMNENIIFCHKNAQHLNITTLLCRLTHTHTKKIIIHKARIEIMNYLAENSTENDDYRKKRRVFCRFYCCCYFYFILSRF